MTAEKDTEQSTAPTPKALSVAKAFVADHGGSARAVVENIGRAGARVVLIGEDGRLGDVMVTSPAVGEALVEAVDGLTAHEWDSETTAALKIGAAHRRKMSGRNAG
ncbi:hypothetical protein E1202_22825 [Saccharopolyspora karakumensis]|uniref:Uncharacterized protein n=1 Tax=Saccharopolyspora karakumensis TaxID=2530386 RepID=A0A4R5BI24_9PSEU|nr:hypothetical protein [Saccharopolyspora karakumensis]TDD84706.1 hypothetical protein E1202_22825 [Saccharopolyspora karakumensis]